MTTGEEIDSAFQTRGVACGGILFLRASDAIALKEAARGTGTLCRPERWPEGVDRWTRAVNFILRQPADLFFEVVLED